MISLSHLTFSYPHQPPLFEDFSWQVAAGQAWAVLGASGCGKTTLLYLLAGLLQPTHGSLQVGGTPLLRPRPQTGLVLQDYGLLPWATVRQNVQLGLQLRSFYGPDGKHSPSMPAPTQPVDAWLERLGIAGVAGQYPQRLSGGQRQRTAIARTLVLHPDLLLMDEPFSSLDALTRESLQDLALELWREQGFTLVIVTHAIEEAACLGQNLLLLSQAPQRQAWVIPNPGSLEPDWRSTAAYQDFCRTVRGYLKEARVGA
jgi:ABC-type nitrate/sulfonate/bicarbonate transport system ATPase subunit